MITLTIVRHGESTDNLKEVWAGWADAPLSNHGMNQAKALGKSLATTKFDYIYASPLKRAHWTAQQIELQNEHKPPLEVSPLVQEQHFGQAERQPFTSYPRPTGRTSHFPDGESLDDVRNRANVAIAELIEPHLREQVGCPAHDRHIVVVAHGIFNHELLSALRARRPIGIEPHWGYKGMGNTGWTRLEVGYEGEELGLITLDDLKNLPGPAPLWVTTTDTNVVAHLDKVERQKGGIGSSAHDEKQRDIRAFFSGADQD